jgi:hypothetical protein
MKTKNNYNGFRSWNAWNVSLWINNQEVSYQLACDLVRRYNLGLATKIFIGYFSGKTPDGAIYNRLSVYNALKEIKENL